MPAGDPLNWRAGVFFCGWKRLLAARANAPSTKMRIVGCKEGISTNFALPYLKVRVSRPDGSLRSRKNNKFQIPRKSLHVLRFSHDLIRLFIKKLKKFHKKNIFSIILLYCHSNTSFGQLLN